MNQLLVLASTDDEKIDGVKTLLRSSLNIDVNFQDSNGTYNNSKSALHFACWNGHCEVACLLLEAGTDINMKSLDNEWTALHYASQKGHAKIVQLLLDYGADYSIRNQKNITALFYAVKHGHVEIVRLLLAAGALIENKDEFGMTLLHVAILRGFTDIVSILLQVDNDGGQVDVNEADTYGVTPLETACRYNYHEIVNMLIQAGAHLNQRHPDSGWTALHYALYKENVDIAKLLLQHGADANIPGNKGETVLDICKQFHLFKMVELLESHHQHQQAHSSSHNDDGLSIIAKKKSMKSSNNNSCQVM